MFHVLLTSTAWFFAENNVTEKGKKKTAKNSFSEHYCPRECSDKVTRRYVTSVHKTLGANYRDLKSSLHLTTYITPVRAICTVRAV
jgi:hypothetical protein